MAFELSGKLIEIFNTIQVKDNFRKREFVVEKKETVGGTEYSDPVKFQLINDRCDIIDSFNLNDQVKVSFNIRGNRWERDGNVNYFINLAAWKIEKESAEFKEGKDVPFPDESDLPAEADSPEDDLPF